MCRLECSSSFNTSIPMKLNQNGGKDQQSGLNCAKLKPGSHRRCLWSRFGHCLFFSISSEKPDIVKVLHETWIWDKLEAIWLFREQTILWVQAETIDEEITWWKLTSPLDIVCSYLCLSLMLKLFQSLIWRGRQEWTTTASNLIVFRVKLMFES